MFICNLPLTEFNATYVKLLPSQKLPNCISDLEILVTLLNSFSLYHSMSGPDKGNSSTGTSSSVEYFSGGVCMFLGIIGSPVVGCGLKKEETLFELSLADNNFMLVKLT